MRTAAHRVLVALLLALIGVGWLVVGGSGVQAQDVTVGYEGDGSLQLGFPFPFGETWGFGRVQPTAVPTTGAVWGAMGFYLPAANGFDGVPGGTIAAARGGTVSRPCANMVKINHGTFSTVYYPVAGIAVTAGATVARGQALGVTTDAPGGCAGAVDDGSADVQMWIEQGGGVVDPIGMDIGGWTRGGYAFDPGSQLLRGDRYLDAGYDQVTNDGEAGTTSAPHASIHRTTTFDSVVVGDEVNYGLRGYPANTTVTMEFRRPNGTVVALGTRTTSAGGAVIGRFTVPATTRGANNVLVGRTPTVTRLVPVDVSPRVEVTPYRTTRSGAIAIRLTGFPASAPITLTATFEGEAPRTITPNPSTDATGGLTTTYTIPAGAARDSARIRAQHTPSGVDAEGVFLVTGTAAVGVTPEEVRVGSQVTVTIRAFPANTNVTVALDGVTLGTPRTDANGNADFAFTAVESGDQFAGIITATAGSVTEETSFSIVKTFDITTASAPPDGEAVANVTGFRIGDTVYLYASDGETSYDIGEYPVAANRTVTFPVPSGAARGTTITILAVGGYAGYDELAISDPGSATPPIADAGPDQSVDAPPSGVVVQLTGAGSGDGDPGGSIVAYTWRDEGNVIATGRTPTATLSPGIHEVELTVRDNANLTSRDTVVITVNALRRPPVAAAGPDQTVSDVDGAGGQIVTLNGTGSTDPDGNATITSYVWREGTTRLATGRTATVPLPIGVHAIELTVTDDTGLSATDTVVVTVTGPPAPPTLTLDKLSGKFNGLVTATLSGFTPSSAVTLTWPNLFPVDANGAPSTDLLGSGTTDGAGRATLTFRTPLQPFVSAGYVVTARDAAGKSATATHRVIPRIALNEVEGTGSTRLRVYFYGFAPNERIEVRWHAGPDGTSPSSVIFTLTVAANGRAVSTAFPPPPGALGGHKVVGKVIGVNRSASTTFTLLAGGASVDDPTPTATPTATATPGATATATPEPAATAEPTVTPTPEPAPTETPTPEPTATATPVPNASPVAAAGEDQTVADADGSGDEPVQLDGGGTTDSEGSELTYSWSVAGVEVAAGPTPSVALPVGATTVVLTVTDAQGATATDEVSITVEAVQPAAEDAGGPEE